jgi:hypothetical protein
VSAEERNQMSTYPSNVLASSVVMGAQQTATNSSGIIHALPVSQFGLAFVLIVDSSIFLLAVAIFFLCYKRTALYKSQKQKSDLSGEELQQSTEDFEPNKNGITRIIERFIKWLFLVKEYEAFGVLYGHEAAVYMWFSKQMFLALTICTTLGLSILLPLHLTGTPPKDPVTFTYGTYNFSTDDFFLVHTTVAMVQDNPNKLWVHVMLTLIFSLVILLFLKRFHDAQFVQRGSALFRGNNQELIYGRVSNYSVEVMGLPDNLLDSKQIREAFEEVYPGQIFSVRIVLDTSRRITLQKKLEEIEKKIRHSEAYIEKYGKRPKKWMCFRGTGICNSQIDGLRYYEGERELIMQSIQEWDASTVKSTGNAFVIFKSLNAATKCAQSGNDGKRILTVHNFKFRIRRAAEPDDLIWENFKVSRGDRNMRIFFVHTLLVILLIFFTSPLSILSAITAWINKVDWLNKIFTQLKGFNGTGVDLLLQYLPTLLLFIISNTLPYALYYLSSIEKYKSHSKINRVNLLRLYIYLLLTTLILPSLLQVSIDSIIQYSADNDVTDIFNNVFLPASGVFFVSYCIQYMLLGNSIDILRITSFIKYLWRRSHAITEEEKEESLQVAEFDSGFEYSFLISFFGIIVTYSVFSPLMLAIGILYSISKYIIDRHNITILVNKNTRASHKVVKDLFAYREKTKLVTILTLTNIIIFQSFMLIFFAKNGSPTYLHTLVLFVILLVTFIYAVTWAVRYKTEILLVPQDSTTAPLMDEVHLSEEEEDMISSHYLPRFKTSYLAPYALESYPPLRQQIEEDAEMLQKEQENNLDIDIQ